jgi:hypothetical protein
MGAAAILGLTAFQVASQVGQGYAQQAEAKYNASLLEGKAKLIDVQKEIEFAQYERMKNRMLSTSVANVAAAGLMPTGSAAAAMIDAQTNIGIDQAIGQFNFEQEKRYTLAEAAAIKRKGAQAVIAGYTNAFSTALKGGFMYGQQKGWFNTDAGARTGNIGPGTTSHGIKVPSRYVPPR